MKPSDKLEAISVKLSGITGALALISNGLLKDGQSEAHDAVDSIRATLEEQMNELDCAIQDVQELFKIDKEEIAAQVFLRVKEAIMAQSLLQNKNGKPHGCNHEAALLVSA